MKKNDSPKRKNLRKQLNGEKIIILEMLIKESVFVVRKRSELYRPSDRRLSAKFFFFLIRAVGLWVLRPLLAYCTSPG
jgi:hypothetical protein